MIPSASLQTGAIEGDTPESFIDKTHILHWMKFHPLKQFERRNKLYIKRTMCVCVDSVAG